MKDFKITKENLHLVIDYMPEAFHKLSVVIGEDMALKLFEKYRGINLPIGKNKTAAGRLLHQKLIEVIGENAANKFTFAFAMSSAKFFNIPRCIKDKQVLRDIQIKQ
ncbi:hypothetical protein [Neisseria musculi]|uniref:Uncharacterized protein n=1 Tax=Neisseria musculi TaxID=1815583 RepID=A0A7H1MAD9_9NEIS|nr:hypothetical protein [Neisseria musculi]QNT58604.1 hypothetical protein H7A79_1764 [Neisseria musculi]